jgi:hypothetical protein
MSISPEPESAPVNLVTVTIGFIEHGSITTAASRRAPECVLQDPDSTPVEGERLALHAKWFVADVRRILASPR